MKELRDFVIGHRSGISSVSLIAALVPQLNDLCLGKAGTSFGDIPYDPSDFNRCVQALDLIPDGRERLHLVAYRWPRWAPVVENWDRWRGMLEKALKTKSKRAHDLFEEMAATRTPDPNTIVIDANKLRKAAGRARRR